MENTACCHYWTAVVKSEAKLCSECDPGIGKWHGKFPKEKPTAENKKAIQAQGLEDY